MEGTNYNHLFYFWTVASHGSVSKASTELGVSQPTISEQLRKLEDSMGVKLFERAGRGLRLSEAGQIMFTYADQIFRLGKDMNDAVRGHAPRTSVRLAVGITPPLHKLTAHHLIAPALQPHGNLRLVCVEDRPEQLFARLALHQLDLVLSAAPIRPNANIRACSHRLTRSGVSFLGVPKLCRSHRFPHLLDGAPFLMPDQNSTLSHSLQSWFDKHKLRPEIVGEFSDSALLETFGQRGVGVFAVPTIVEKDIMACHGLKVFGRTTAIGEEFYAITTEKRITNPAAAAILKAADR